MAVGVIGLSVVSAVGGFAVGPLISSPAEVALRSQPPVPAPILVPVEQRVLSADVVTRGTGRFGLPQKLAVTTSLLRSSPALVSDVAVAGSMLAEGDVALTASGRPLFVLVGSRPMSRDLGPGVVGDDVRQLEAAMERLGFRAGVVDGVFDSATEAAVADWYRSKGFNPTTSTAEQIAAIRTREAALDTARIDAIMAADSLALARGLLVSARAALHAAVERANTLEASFARVRTETDAALAAAERDVLARGAMLDAIRTPMTPRPASPAQIAVAEADLAAARSNHAATRAAGARALTDADLVRDRAPERLAAAERAAIAANTVAQSDIAAKQAALVSARMPLPSVDGQVIDVAGLQAKISAAEADLATARANAENVRTVGEQAIADARVVLVSSPDLADRTRAQAAAADAAAERDVAAKLAALDALASPPAALGASLSEVAAAERELIVAIAARDAADRQGERLRAEAKTATTEAMRDVATKRGGVTFAEQAVVNAERARQLRSAMTATASRALDDSNRRAGVQVPADEVVFVAESPVRVAKLVVGPGDAKSGALMLVTDTRVRVDGGLPVKDASLVRPGMTVKITEPDLGISAVGLVTSVASGPGTNGVDGFHVYFELDVEDPPAVLVGASVRLNIPVRSTGNRVLAVPVSALSLAPDGSSRVQRQRGTVLESVAVRPGLAAGGYVAITPIDARNDSALRAGDLVMVGFEDTPGSVETSASSTARVTSGSGPTNTNRVQVFRTSADSGPGR